MTKASDALRLYRQFLEGIPLDEYREKLRDVKWVEQDLYPELLPLKSIFRNYWDNQRFLPSESWFEEFWQELHSSVESAAALRSFKKYYFDKDGDGWFKLGFKARMWRTWTPILTQLDFCYVFVNLCDRQGKHVTLECNAELDRRGIDARVGDIEFQVAKISQRKEARPGASRRDRITIPYAVFNIEEYVRLSHSPRVRERNRLSYCNALQAFNKYFKRLKNGFVVFSEYYVEQIIANLDSIEKLRASVDKVSLELSGE